MAQLTDAARLPELLGPRVAKRHRTATWRREARVVLAEREEARARRLGETVLSETQLDALRAAGSRLLGLVGEGGPLTALGDDALRSLGIERDPEVLSARLAEVDPEGGWDTVPRVELLAGLVLVAASAEAKRRWRVRSREHQERLRARRSRTESRDSSAATA